MSKVVVITGATSGMGLADAKLLAANGYNVMLAARREEQLKQIVDDINKEGKGKAAYKVTDVSKNDDMVALMKATVDEFGKIDVLINNAGIAPGTPFTDFNVKNWDAILDINLKGMIYGMGAVMPYFMKQKSGQVINMDSILGFMSGPTLGGYSASKFGVRGATEAFRQEAIPYNIRVTLVCPGAVRTNITHMAEGAEKERLKKMWDEASISAETVAWTIKQAIELPDEAAWNEIIIRPTKELM